MKFWITLLLIIAINQVYAQQDIVFDSVYVKGEGRTLKVLNSEELIVGGYNFTSGNAATGILMKLSSEGAVIWYREITNTILNLVRDIAIDEKGNVYVIGESKGFTTFLTKYDKNGKQLWYKSLGEKQSYYSGIKIEINTNGNLAYITNRKILVLLNPEGEEMKRVDMNPAKSMTVNSFIFDNENNIIAIGFSEENIHLIKLNSKGEKVAEFSKATPAIDWGYDIAATTNGGYVVIAHTDVDAKKNNHNLYTAKFNSDLKIIWEKKLFMDNYGNGFDQICSLQNGDVVVSTNVKVQSNYIDIKVLWFNSKGELIGSKTYGGRGSDMPFGLGAIENNVFVTGVMDKSFWVVKIDKEVIE